MSGYPYFDNFELYSDHSLPDCWPLDDVRGSPEVISYPINEKFWRLPEAELVSEALWLTRYPQDAPFKPASGHADAVSHRHGG